MILIGTAAGLLLAAGTAYLALALFRVAEWRERPCLPATAPPLTLMIPAHGAPPRLAECLRSVLAQDYPGPLQVVFGLHRADDPARAVIDEVIADHPGLDATVVVDGRRAGANPKNCNLANMMAAVRHEVIVMVDSDVLAPPHLLSTLAATLLQEGVGAATCPYRGEPRPGLWPRLGALWMDDWFIPSVLVDAGRRPLDTAYGAAIAVRRAALEAVGGFEAMASAVAQDFVLGHSIARAGFAVRLAPCLVGTIVAEASAAELLGHELRWHRTVRAVRPRDHALAVVTFPLLPFLLLAGLAWPGRAVAAGALLLSGLRLGLHWLLRCRLPLASGGAWLLPLREGLAAGVWAASLAGRRIRWGGRVMTTGGGLTMHVDEKGGRP